MRNNGLSVVCFEALEERVLLSAAPAPVIPVLDDQFSGSKLNAKNWHIPTWTGPTDGTYLGRTQLACSQNYPGPKVSGGSVHMTLDTYNPTGWSFYGTEIISNIAFNPGDQELNIKFVAKLVSPIVGGGVGGLFLYSVNPDGVTHNEIDFELLSKWSADGSNRVLTNVYANETLGVGNPVAYVLPNSGKLTDFHTYEIKWSAGSVSWLVDGVLLRTDTSNVPTGQMNVYVNFWAPDQTWPDAYNGGIQPSNKENNIRLNMDVSSVRVDIPLTVSDANVNAAASAVLQKTYNSANGAILGTGSGKIRYYWVVQGPDGVAKKFGSTKTAKMVNGAATIPTIKNLPVSNPGDYKVWVEMSGTFGSFKSNAACYNVVAPTPIVVTDASVNVIDDSVILKKRGSANGTILGTGSGKIRYYWVAQGPDGVAKKIGSTKTAVMVNGYADIPTYSSLPASKLGDYKVWVNVVIPNGVFQSGMSAYTVVPVPAGIKITSVSAYGTSGYAKGKISGGKPADYDGVAVYILVGSGWWTKPYWGAGITRINSDGTWSAYIDTGGDDKHATKVRAYLIPKGRSSEVFKAYGGSTIYGMDDFAFAEVSRR